MNHEEVLRKCEELMKQASSSFYMAFSGLPSPKREAVHVIYAFCRMIDDSVDEPEKSVYGIHELREQFIHLEHAEGHFIWPALRWLFRTFPRVDKKPFLLQMEGQLIDLEFTRYESMEQLERYAYLVAGTVGEMLLPVLRDDEGEEAKSAGIALGIGMQLVNIIRDVGEDLGRGRRYLPLEIMEKHGYRQQELENGEVNARLVAVLEELRNESLKWFEKGLRNIDEYPPESGMAVELAAGFYAGILNAVVAAGYDVFRRRAFVSDEEKLNLLRRVASRYVRKFGGQEAAAVM